ncbi:MAG: class I SAM-dependent methyltransferase [Acidimicrobiia bacterium]
MASTGAFGWFWATVYGLTHRNPESNRAVIDLIDLEPADRVLDIGCGPGAALLRASTIVTQGSLTGIDPTEKLARLAARRVHPATIEVASVEDMPFPDGSFTVAWSISAYHHWPDQTAGLDEVHRVLEEGGSLHIAERHARGPGQHGLDGSEIALLENRLSEAGFGTLQVRFIELGRKEMAVVSARA